MKAVLQSTPPEDFIQPQGLVTVRIDPVSGLLARSGCPDQRDELFIEGTEPSDECDLHAGGFKGWLQKLFRKRERPMKNIELE
jgi:membrane carboxypeptidase/penicillin-binding protein